jgi:hypothetical protein
MILFLERKLVSYNTQTGEYKKPRTPEILQVICSPELRSPSFRTDGSLERQPRHSRTAASPVHGEELCGLATAAVFKYASNVRLL